MCLQRHPVSVDNQLGQHRVGVVINFGDAQIWRIWSFFYQNKNSNISFLEEDINKYKQNIKRNHSERKKVTIFKSIVNMNVAD